MTESRVLVSVRTTGCRVNQSDTDALLDGISDLPVRVVRGGEPAQVAVINACTVTGPAERDGRNAVYRALRSCTGPVILTGCMARRLSKSGENGFDERVRLVDPVGLQDELRAVVEGLSPGPNESGGLTGHAARARPVVKVQDGCDGSCAYCIVPTVRGPSRSIPMESVLTRVLDHAASGVSEVVLAGVDLASWGKETGSKARLPDLLDRLVRLDTGMRFRLSSIEPDGIEDRLTGIVAGSGDVCPHLHVPMQSGCDGVLRAMGRRYLSSDFEKVVAHANRRIPGLTLGLDVMCGFPGEDDEAFEETRGYLDSLPFTYLHVFPYSPRPGTPAFGLGDPVPHQVKADRCRVLRRMSEKRREQATAALVGAYAEVVDIKANDTTGVESLARDYTRVIRAGTRAVTPGRFTVKITGFEGATAISARGAT